MLFGQYSVSLMVKEMNQDVLPILASYLGLIYSLRPPPPFNGCTMSCCMKVARPGLNPLTQCTWLWIKPCLHSDHSCCCWILTGCAPAGTPFPLFLKASWSFLVRDELKSQLGVTSVYGIKYGSVLSRICSFDVRVYLQVFLSSLIQFLVS